MENAREIFIALIFIVALAACQTQAATSNQYEITAQDNGKTFTYAITSRFTVILDPNKYPKENLVCEPSGLIGEVSNIPAVPSPMYAARFEAVNVGTCIFRDGDFHVTINVVALQISRSR